MEELSRKEYFHVFESILYGLAVAQLLVSWGKLIYKNGTYKGYWAHIIVTILWLLAIIQRFFARHDLSQYNGVDTSLLFFLFIVLPPILVFINILLYLPEKCEGIDYRELVLKYRWFFITATILQMLVSNITTFQAEGFKQFMWINSGIAILLLTFGITGKLRIFELFSLLGIIYLPILMYFR